MKKLPAYLFASALFLSLSTNGSCQENDTVSEILTAPLPLLFDSPEDENIQTWESSRRTEILDLFKDHVYGRVPAMNVKTDYRVLSTDREALNGQAIRKQVQLILSGENDTVNIDLLIYLPKNAEKAVPLFLGLNFYGNHTISEDPGIRLPGSELRINNKLHIYSKWATDESRGCSASRWPLDTILARGYGLATIYCGDIDKDEDDDFLQGVHLLDQSMRDSSSWGTISAWAWGLSRALDYFEADESVDEKRIAVIGHSRLGKTALWAGARDERFALVISNNSGCGGAAISRRAVGESVERINRVFPHWFADRFKDYNNKEAACPVDQHLLLALMAPRPLYVASATEDQWADPLGEYLSLFYGSKIFKLYGLDAPCSELPPLPDRPRVKGNTAYHLRTGKHDISRWDWEQYLDFADLQLK